MTLSNKKVIVRRLRGELLHGYLPPTNLLRLSIADPDPALDLLDLAGRALPVALNDVKYVAFVRDFNLADPLNPERLTRTAFLARPRASGLWLRLTFAAGDHLEGLAPTDITLLDALHVDAGLFLTPPDDRTNTHRLYVPRAAIASVQFLALIQPAKAPVPPRSIVENPQTDLFPLT